MKSTLTDSSTPNYSWVQQKRDRDYRIKWQAVAHFAATMARGEPPARAEHNHLVNAGLDPTGVWEAFELFVLTKRLRTHFDLSED